MEEEKEIELLSRATVNHLFLGQFEAFRALLLSLRKRKPELSLAILRSVLARGGRFDGVLWSSTCDSPALLAWLSLLEVLEFEGASSILKIDPDMLRLKVEFILLVQIVLSRVSQSGCRLVDSESIEKAYISTEKILPQSEDLAEGANSGDSMGDLTVPMEFLNRISDLGLHRLKGDIGDDDVGTSMEAIPFEEDEFQCLRKLIMDQADIFDALCWNIQKQLHRSDPYDSGLAITVCAEEKARFDASEQELKALTLMQKIVQIAHIDALKEKGKKDDEDGAVSHLRFLHQEYGVEESEYRLALEDLIKRNWTKANNFGHIWHDIRENMLLIYREALLSNCTPLVQMIQVVQCTYLFSSLFAM